MAPSASEHGTQRGKKEGTAKGAEGKRENGGTSPEAVAFFGIDHAHPQPGGGSEVTAAGSAV